jgi:hypothetical protein
MFHEHSICPKITYPALPTMVSTILIWVRTIDSVLQYSTSLLTTYLIALSTTENGLPKFQQCW